MYGFCTELAEAVMARWKMEPSDVGGGNNLQIRQWVSRHRSRRGCSGLLSLYVKIHSFHLIHLQNSVLHLLFFLVLLHEASS